MLFRSLKERLARIPDIVVPQVFSKHIHAIDIEMLIQIEVVHTLAENL